MAAMWIVKLVGSTKEKINDSLTFELADYKEFAISPIAVQEDWMEAVLSTSRINTGYRMKSILKTVIGPQQEDFEGRNVIFVYILLKQNSIPLAFLLGALKDKGHMVLSIWPPQFVDIVKQNLEKETVLSILVQIAKKPELFEFVDICSWVTQERGTSFPPPYAS